jgi:hypothetical protein
MSDETCICGVALAAAGGASTPCPKCGRVAGAGIPVLNYSSGQRKSAATSGVAGTNAGWVVAAVIVAFYALAALVSAVVDCVRLNDDSVRGAAFQRVGLGIVLNAALVAIYGLISVGMAHRLAAAKWIWVARTVLVSILFLMASDTSGFQWPGGQVTPWALVVGSVLGWILLPARAGLAQLLVGLALVIVCDGLTFVGIALRQSSAR